MIALGVVVESVLIGAAVIVLGLLALVALNRRGRRVHISVDVEEDHRDGEPRPPV